MQNQKTFEEITSHVSDWFSKMVESKEFKNPIPYPVFKATIKKWIRSDEQFDKLAQAVKDELLKHNIKVAHDHKRNDWNPDQILQQQQQQQSQPRSSDTRWQQYNEQQFHGHLEQNNYSLTLLAHDENNIIKLIAWIHDVLYKTSNHPNLKQICFSVDFKEVD